MRKQIIFGVAAIAAVLAEPCPSIGQAHLFGTWKLNVEKSTYNPGPPPYKTGTCRIEPHENGLRVTYDLIGSRGGVTHLEWTGKLDGKDYSLQGVDEVLTNAYTKVDDWNYRVVLKLDGEIAATARITISPDLKTITTVTTPRNTQEKSITVYDRR